MNRRIHISTEGDGTVRPKRKWCVPDFMREACARILGGDGQNAASIPLLKRSFSQSREEISIPEVLESLGVAYIEIPEEKTINYREMLKEGYEYIVENVAGAWMVHEFVQRILSGYTGEIFDPSIGHIQCVGEWRTRQQWIHDGGTRYLIHYRQEAKKLADIAAVQSFMKDPEAAQKKCRDLDEFEATLL